MCVKAERRVDIAIGYKGKGEGKVEVVKGLVLEHHGTCRRRLDAFGGGHLGLLLPRS